MKKYLPDNHDMTRVSILRDEGKFVKKASLVSGFYYMKVHAVTRESSLASSQVAG
jgi:hypothetical protein